MNEVSPHERVRSVCLNCPEFKETYQYNWKHCTLLPRHTNRFAIPEGCQYQLEHITEFEIHKEKTIREHINDIHWAECSNCSDWNFVYKSTTWCDDCESEFEWCGVCDDWQHYESYCYHIFVDTSGNINGVGCDEPYIDGVKDSLFELFNKIEGSRDRILRILKEEMPRCYPIDLKDFYASQNDYWYSKQKIDRYDEEYLDAFRWFDSFAYHEKCEKETSEFADKLRRKYINKTIELIEKEYEQVERVCETA